ncbi:hypothetical protein OG315_23800 [Streptomyces atratus]|nr:hypothetical protein [Streptomyces atratus]
MHATLQPVIRSSAPGGRIVVLGVRPSADNRRRAAAQQALEGL